MAFQCTFCGLVKTDQEHAENLKFYANYSCGHCEEVKIKDYVQVPDGTPDRAKASTEAFYESLRNGEHLKLDYLK